ncbi:MAG: hypothetical protein J6O00_11205 [Clostridiales bacterium]|nr:hypothetical protein [Clostridiales bacterium]
MPRSVAEIQAEIAKVKQEIAARDMYRQPQSQVGWATYVGTGDRGLLDAYQNREDQYNKMMKQQTFQAAEAALNRKFQEQEAIKNRMLQEKIARMNRSAASEDRQNEAYLQYQKYVLAREKLKAQGLDTSELDLQINHLADKFGFGKPQETEYDLNKDVNYVLAQSGAYDAINNPLNDGSEDTLESIRERVAQFHTPEAAKELARLDREIKKRDKAIAFNEQLSKDIANYWKTGIMSDLMIELNFEESGVAGNRSLLRGKKVYRRPKYKEPGAKPVVSPISN